MLTGKFKYNIQFTPLPMGRIKTQLVKRTTLALYRDNKDDFKKNFKENKQLVEELADFPSKKIRNVVAGYITRMKKTDKD